MNSAHEDMTNRPPDSVLDRGESGSTAQHSLMQKVLLGAIRTYQLTLSPFIGRQCRFYPTCSHYASEAIAKRGALKGAQLTLRRLARCHPFHPGGVDLVPLPQKENKNTKTLASHP